MEIWRTKRSNFWWRCG